LWDFGTGKLISNIPWQSGLGREPCLLYSVQFSKNNGAEYIIAGGSGANDVKLFHRSTGKIIGELNDLKKGIYTVDFSEDSKFIGIGGLS
jgi:hypothetical protein